MSYLKKIKKIFFPDRRDEQSLTLKRNKDSLNLRGNV